MKKGMKMKALKAAFPYTIPIMAGFLFLGMTYGMLMNASGFSVVYPLFMSMTIFAGSIEFLTVHMLLGAFNPLQSFLVAVMVNARHLFYGLSMLDRYKNVGKKKVYLIFGMCDESFSINYTADIPEDVDKGWFYLWVTLLNQIYWVTGSTIGCLLGSVIHFSTKGLDFCMTAMFVVIFLEQWRKEKEHHSEFIGFAVSVLCLLVFGADNFIIPSMLGILLILLIGRKRWDKEVEK